MLIAAGETGFFPEWGFWPEGRIQTYPFLWRLSVLLFVLCLSAAAYHDWKRRRIPNYCILPIWLLAVLNWALCGFGSAGILAAGAGAVSVPFYVLHRLRPKGLGKADVKLTAAIGAYGGCRTVLQAVILGVLLSACYCLAVLLCGRSGREKGEEGTGRFTVPLGTFICIGTLPALAKEMSCILPGFMV